MGAPTRPAPLPPPGLYRQRNPMTCTPHTPRVVVCTSGNATVDYVWIGDGGTLELSGNPGRLSNETLVMGGKPVPHLVTTHVTGKLPRTVNHRYSLAPRPAVRWYFVVAAVLAVLAWGATAFAQPVPPPARPTFLIGVYKQPSKDFAKWKARGINLIYEWEPGAEPKAQFEKGAQDHGLWFVNAPAAWDDATLRAEVAQPYRLGHQQPDEPDLVTHLDKPGSAMPDLRRQHAAVKAAGGRMHLMLAGDTFINQWYDGLPKAKTDASKWGHRATIPGGEPGYMGQADVILWDRYLQDRNQTGAFDLWRTLMLRARDWSVDAANPKGRPQVVVIEASYDQLKAQPPAGYLRQQVEFALAFAKENDIPLAGFVYWAHGKRGTGITSFDGLTPETVAEMTAVNAELNARFNAPPFVPTPADKTLLEVVKAIDQTNARIRDMESRVEAMTRAVTDARAETRAAIDAMRASIDAPLTVTRAKPATQPTP